MGFAPELVVELGPTSVEVVEVALPATVYVVDFVVAAVKASGVQHVDRVEVFVVAAAETRVHLGQLGRPAAQVAELCARCCGQRRTCHARPCSRTILSVYVHSLIWVTPRLESECFELKVIAKLLVKKFGKDHPLTSNTVYARRENLRIFN